MRIDCVNVNGGANTTPSVIATGVVGGGRVSILSDRYAPIGTEEMKTDPKKSMKISDNTKYYDFYLNEGENLYGKNSSTYTNDSVAYHVIYHNTPAIENSKPINLTGNINLSQS